MITKGFTKTKKAFLFRVSQDIRIFKDTHRNDGNLKHHCFKAKSELEKEGFIKKDKNATSQYILTEKGRKAFFELQPEFRKIYRTYF